MPVTANRSRRLGRLPGPDHRRGISGLAMAVRLAQAGIAYTVVDKNPDVGGTWHENFYPGCGVDTPSYLYALSFDPKPDWSSYFAPQSELADYWRTLAQRHGVLANTRLSTLVHEAQFDEATSKWEVSIGPADGDEATETLVADVVISAVGLLNQPSIPDLPGLSDFGGPTLHTARWDRSVDLAGKRVAVIGTGASAMQFVPASAEVAQEVRVFQRTAQWAIPHPLKGAEVSAAVHFLNEHVPTTWPGTAPGCSGAWVTRCGVCCRWIPSSRISVGPSTRATTGFARNSPPTSSTSSPNTRTCWPAACPTIRRTENAC